MKLAEPYVAMAHECGLAVERVARGKHFKLYLRAKNGKTTVITAPISGSDVRGDRNKRAQLRKFARDNIEQKA